MRYTIKRYSIPIVSFFVLIIIAIRLELEAVIPVNSFLVIIATIFTIFISVINLYFIKDKFFKKLFKEFNDRYESMETALINLPEDLPFKTEEQLIVIKYLNLSAEEYMWVKKGWIDAYVWTSWKKGILEQLKNRAIFAIFEQEKDHSKHSYYGFIEEILKELKKGESQSR